MPDELSFILLKFNFTSVPLGCRGLKGGRTILSLPRSLFNHGKVRFSNLKTSRKSRPSTSSAKECLPASDGTGKLKRKEFFSFF